MSVIEIAPVVKTLDVRRSAADAFLAPENNTKAIALVVEPHPGGRVYEKTEDGRTFDWGEVLVFEPGARFAMTWQLGRAREASGEVEVRFEPTGAQSCRVTLAHTGWERMEDGAKMREGYNIGWGEVFGRRYAALAAAA